MMKSCGVHVLSWILVVVGGLNWGLVGLGYFVGGNLNLVNLLLGSMPAVEAVVYLVVGLATVAMLFKGKCGACIKS